MKDELFTEKFAEYLVSKIGRATERVNYANTIQIMLNEKIKHIQN